MKALHIAATGMAAQQMKVDVVANNLANMSTTGFNPRRADFADLHYQQMARPGSITATDGSMLPTGVQIGLGVRPAAVSVVLGQGSLDATGGDLDLAIDGAGYLEVEMPSGQIGYTRDGALKRSADGLIVTSEGYPVVPGLTIPTDARGLTISPTAWTRSFWASLTCPTFRTKRGWKRSGRTSFWKARPRGRPSRARRVKTVWGRFGRATSSQARSIPCAR
jgi:flagellar basal-body rod protein FlgG